MSNSFRLSKEQAAAVKSFGADLGVSAGAGSGKTTVLVERYLEAVKVKGAWPENILAVTFTDKAANVMKERLRQRCDELGLEEVRRRLDGAWIGTIHSFCARFLKENPLECGVDPLFTVMGAGEQEMLMEKALDMLFEQEFESGLFVRLLADSREEDVRSGLKAFYDKQRAFAGEKDLLRSAPPEKERARAEEALRAALEREAPEKGAKLSAPEEKLASACRDAIAALKAPAGWVRRAKVAEALDVLDLRSSKTKERVASIRSLEEAWSLLEVQMLAVPFKNEWKRLIGRFAEIYETEKRRLGVHDYEDLLVLTHRALSGLSVAQKALRSRTQKHFQYIFVDEYQDTSVLQARIFELIKRKDDLFVVGDVRQSIYRFRHAHPEIFLDALKRSKTLSLAENYRSRPEILAFVDRVFAHEPLVPKRPFQLKKEHCLEVISVPRADGKSLDAHRVLEARTIAGRIRAMVKSGFRVEEGGKARAAQWKDFAVLLRRTTVSRLYEKELEAAGIPYYANKGRGFYDKIEVADLVNLLRVIESPFEDIAMASVLRSPLVQVSDDALYWLSHRRLSEKPEGTLHQAVLRHAGIPEISKADHAKLAEFLPLLERLSAQKDRLRISEILHAAVLGTAYEAKVLTRPDGRQARANVWKLIEMAGRIEDKSARSISDLILYLQSVSESSETEAEARIVGEQEDVVRLLTVHAAKGLEFPVVVLADLGGEEGKSGKPLFLASVAEGLGAKLRDPEGSGFCEDAAYKKIQDDEKQKEAGQADRLLYVAMTRAKEHLILSGVASPLTARLEQALAAGDTAFHCVPVVSVRPERAEAEPPWAVSLNEDTDQAPAETIEKNLEPVDKSYEALEDLTVSRLVAAVEQAHWDGVRSEETEPDEEPEEEDEATPRNEFGTLFHLLMELSTRHSLRGQLAAGRMDALTSSLTPDEKKEIETAFRDFWKGPLGLAVKKAPQCYPELPFIYKTRRGLLKGQIDLVFRDKGGWVILDYKTNRIAGPADRERAVASYTWQLGLYALAFWKLYGEIPARTLLYFSCSQEVVEKVWSEKELGQLEKKLESLYQTAVSA